jgi:hypothetical protein
MEVIAANLFLDTGVGNVQSRDCDCERLQIICIDLPQVTDLGKDFIRDKVVKG